MGPGVEVQTFEGMTMLGRRYWSRIVVTGNSEILFTSQRYKTKIQRDRTAARAAQAWGCTVVPGKRR